MEKKKYFIIFGIGLFLVFIFLISNYCFFKIGVKKSTDNSSNLILEEESKTKDIKNVKYEEIVISSEDGAKVELSESKNIPVMLLFWNADNEDSVKVLYKVEELYKNYSGKINFYMISTSENVSDEIKNNVSLKIYYDLDGLAQEKYNVKELPSMIYINQNNEVFNAKSGFTTTDALEANLDILSNNI